MPNPAYEKLKLQWAQRRERARRLKAKGKTLDEIGTILGVSKQRVKQMVDAAKGADT